MIGSLLVSGCVCVWVLVNSVVCIAYMVWSRLVLSIVLVDYLFAGLC